jgi:hypothetical protein
LVTRQSRPEGLMEVLKTPETYSAKEKLVAGLEKAL